MAGLYDDTPGLSDGTGLWRGRLGLFSGASGFINGGGAAYIDLYFSAGTYSVSGSNYTTLGSIPGFTFTRASLAMGYDATGKLTYGPNNLLLQSQTFGTTWAQDRSTVTSNATTAPDGTLTADKLVEDSTPANSHRAAQGVSSQVGSSYILSVYLKAAERTFAAVYISGPNVGIYVNLTTGAYAGNLIGAPTAYAITNEGNGWWRVSVLGTSPSGASVSPQIYTADAAPNYVYTGNGTSGIYLWGAQLEAVTYQTTPSTYYPTTTAAYYGPRLVYDPVTLASLGILVEEARTNLCLRSQTFDSATWTKQGGNTTVTANATTSPDGTADADLFTEAASGVISASCYQSITGAAGAYTWSVFFKAGSGSTRFLRLVIASSASDFGYMTVNMSTGAITQAAGVIGTATAASGDVTTLTGGWYRARLTTTLAAAPTIQFFVPLASGTASVVAGDYGRDTYTANGSTWSLYQAQLELGQGASSPIPTTTASVTRAADDAVLTGLSLPGPCSFATDALAPAFVSTDARHTLSDGNTNNRLWLSYNGSILNVNAMVANTGVSPVSSPTVAPGVAFKAAQSSNNGTYLSVVNGGTVETASGGVMPTLTRLDIGKNAASSLRYWNNAISRIRIYNRALSDAQLQAITQSLLLQEDGYSILQEDNSYIWLE